VEKLKIISLLSGFIVVIISLILFAITKNGIFLAINAAISVWYLGMLALFALIKHKKEFDGYKSELSKMKQELRRWKSNE
jgi:hypothetical protein